MNPEKIKEAIKGGKIDIGLPYYEDKVVQNIGDYIYDHEEHGYVFKVLEKDILYSCGIDCCGIAHSAQQIIYCKEYKNE
jgi:hypothetical protein